VAVGKRIVTLEGEPVELEGAGVEVGDEAPDFTVVKQGLETVSFSRFQGNTCIISSVVSLDTGVCDAQTRRFNEAAADLDEGVRILTISMDLPFAQQRWCGAKDVDRMLVFSDHRLGSFGKAYGLLLKDMRLLARAVFVVDPAGVLRYSEIVKEVTDHPDYDGCLEAAREFV
jgi:thiol peroxidase